MELVIYNRIIDTDVEIILEKLKIENTHQYLKDIRSKGENVSITCPFHKEGKEKHPSCSVCNSTTNPRVAFGTFHCFTCGESGPLYKLVSKVLSCKYEESKHWLIENFSNTIEDRRLQLTEFVKSEQRTNLLDSSILEQYQYFHPYQFQRGLTEDIIRRFRVGYNHKTDSITFPIWDDKGNLIGITERSVRGKRFHIPKGLDKPVYLLNEIKSKGITECIVCEGQIDALVAWSRGAPAVALIGAGTTDNQIKLLDKSGIRHFILMYDNDLAGQHGAMRLKNGLSKDKMITEITMPKGTDIASCDNDTFFTLLRNAGINIEKLCLQITQ